MGIREQVINSIQGVTGTPAEEITDPTTFDELGADSLDVIDIIMTLEEDFDIEISSRDVDKIYAGTVEDLVTYMEAHAKALA